MNIIYVPYIIDNNELNNPVDYANSRALYCGWARGRISKKRFYARFHHPEFTYSAEFVERKVKSHWIKRKTKVVKNKNTNNFIQKTLKKILRAIYFFKSNFEFFFSFLFLKNNKKFIFEKKEIYKMLVSISLFIYIQRQFF